MKSVFVIEDESHAQWHGTYDSFEDAIEELTRRKEIPWSATPNRCPCSSWRTCGRSYEIVEYNAAKRPWEEISRQRVLEVSANGVRWFG